MNTATKEKKPLNPAIALELQQQAAKAWQDNNTELERLQRQMESLRLRVPKLYKQMDCAHDEGFTGTNDGTGGFDIETCNKCGIERIY